MHLSRTAIIFHASDNAERISAVRTIETAASEEESVHSSIDQPQLNQLDSYEYMANIIRSRGEGGRLH